jgi:alpha-glucosidase
LGLKIAKGATLFMLGLPGASYLFQGEELGLPEHTTLEDKYRQDPTFIRTDGQRVGRDGSRVPMPWEKGNQSNGFSETGASWLPQPPSYQALARDQQFNVAGSTLEFYKAALQLRTELKLGEGSFDWVNQGELLSYKNGDTLVLHNFSETPQQLPKGELLLASAEVLDGLLPAHASCYLSF